MKIKFARHKHDTDRTKLERCCTKSSTDAVSLCFGFYRCCLCLAKLIQPCRFQCVTWYIFADQVCFGSYVLRHIRLRFLHANSELTQQDRGAKKAANLVRQAWQWFSLKKIGLKLHLPLNRSFRKRLKKHWYLVKITTKRASNNPVTFVTHKHFASPLFQPSCCVNSPH